MCGFFFTQGERKNYLSALFFPCGFLLFPWSLFQCFIFHTQREKKIFFAEIFLGRMLDKNPDNLKISRAKVCFLKCVYKFSVSISGSQLMFLEVNTTFSFPPPHLSALACTLPSIIFSWGASRGKNGTQCHNQSWKKGERCQRCSARKWRGDFLLLRAFSSDENFWLGGVGWGNSTLSFGVSFFRKRYKQFMFCLLLLPWEEK